MSKDYFDKVAAEWDHMRKVFFSNNVRLEAYSYIDVKSKPFVVDVGAGTGFVSEGLIELGVNVVAVDQSPAMLEVLESKFKNYTNLNCLLGDAENIPLASETADYVIANMYLHHVESPKAAINEMLRILRPGGRIIITDLESHSFHFLREEHHDLWMGFSHDELKSLYKDEGLREIQVFSLNERCCSKSCNDNEKANIGIFLATGIKESVLRGGGYEFNK